jgi:hypothetical protein
MATQSKTSGLVFFALAALGLLLLALLAVVYLGPLMLPSALELGN